MQPLGRNSDTLDGLNSSLVIIDELHSIKDRNTYEVMKQSQSARRQPLLVMITTAGTVRECIFDDMYKYACGVCDGTIQDEHFLPVLYELDDKENNLETRSEVKKNLSIFESGNMTPQKSFTAENVLDSEEYRSAFFKTMLGHKLSEVEQRAFNMAVETRNDAYNTSTLTTT